MNDELLLLVPDRCHSRLREIFAHSNHDFHRRDSTLSRNALEFVQQIAVKKLIDRLKVHPIQSIGELDLIWNQIVTDYHRQNGWEVDGVVDSAPAQTEKTKTVYLQARRFFLHLFFGMVIIKGALIYFGSRYSIYPDAGYGWGLSLTLAFSVSSAILLVWRHRDTDF